MRQRNTGNRPNKRRAGSVHVVPGQQRHTLSRKLKTCPDHAKGVTPRTAMRVIAPRGLGKASTTNDLLHHFAYMNLYAIEKSGRRTLWVRPMLHVVVDAFSLQILEATCVTETTSPKS